MYFDICSPLFEVKFLISELTTFKWKQSSAKAMKKSVISVLGEVTILIKA